MTIDDLAATLRLTRTAVRAQLTALMSNGVVEPRGARKGASKPARLFAVTAEAEQELSRAYVPVLIHLLKQLSRRMSPAELDGLMHEVGRGLGPAHPASGELRQRVDTANRLLEDLGAITSITEENGRYRILGQACPLALATAQLPEACSIVTSLLTAAIGQPVINCCNQYDRKRCCFDITEGAA